MAAKNLVFCTLMLTLLALGIFDYLLNVESNGCEMTYMWEKPRYMVVPGISEKIKQKFPQYSLHLYGEGRYADQSENMKLRGIPVLFIPGNAGSYKQVRSLGSVALRKAEKSSYHFNYFVVNLNGEFSGLYGGILDGQTEYVHHCLKHILTLYKLSKTPPKSVVLVGHSMGGIIARALFTLPDFNPALVHTIVTQATPHMAPVIEMDIHLAQFYNKVNQFWIENQNTSALQDVTVLTVGGGERDFQVRAGLTSTRDVVAGDRSISAVTSGIPKVWVSTDHQCVVWCRQLVLATKRAMYDIIDPNTRQVSTDADFKMQVFGHHFGSHSGAKKPPTGDKGEKKFIGNKWVLVSDSQWNKPPEELKPSATINYMLPLTTHRKTFDSVVIVTNMVDESWISTCTNVSETKCVSGSDISNKAELIPPLYTNYKVLHLSLTDLQDGVSHLVITTPKLQRSDVKVEFYNSSERLQLYEARSVFMAAMTDTVITKTQPGQVLVNIGVKGFDLVHQAHTAILTPLECEDGLNPKMNTTIRMHVPWYKDNIYSVDKATEVNILSLRLQLNKPADEERLVELQVYLNPQCQYKVEMKSSFKGCLGQMIRFYSLLLPSFIINNIIMVLLRQLQLISQNEYCHSFTYVQSDYNKPFKVVPPVLLLKTLLGVAYFGNLWKTLQLPPLDTEVLQNQYIGFGPLALIMFLFGYALTALISSALTGFVKFIGTIILYGIRPRIDIKSEEETPGGGGGGGGAPWVLYFAIGVLISTALRLCGTISLVVGFVLYFFKVAWQYAVTVQTKNCLNMQPKETEDNDSKPADNSPLQIPEVLLREQNSFHYHFSLLYLWAALLTLNMPALVVWVKNLEYSVSLNPDPSIHVTIIACVSLMVLLDPRHTLPVRRDRIQLLSKLMFLSCIGLVAVGMISLYRISYLIAGIFGLLALLQL
ncbi:GPI inositol-deacylase-like [Glandiceps talaboti]